MSDELHHEKVGLSATATAPLPSDSNVSPREKSQDSDASNIGNGRLKTGWVPTILRPWSLLAFLLIYVGMFLTLIGLYVKSNREQGLSYEKESRQYLWTYGPTAVFTILVAFCGYLDY
ncbi:hypothetical protein H072_5439 [Dactylellina haptotyla CBS 200.50]|uniref:Uncharacterized protein n=1 Tax=Dactylellina haptotyla (strain CBS 200.50) TaxID=1284197 RepID=S8AHP9_DACHA|nr:hypothetical protein H072_5439 [Dactylellina haptotyla CBS 200.50]